MGTRRANRESYLASAPDANGYWRGAVWVGLKANGKPDRRWVRRKSETARNKRVRELERKRDAGTLGRPGRAPVLAALLTRHLDVVMPQRGRAPRTIDGYRSVVECHIVPALGAIRVDRLATEDVEDFEAAMLAAGAAPAYVRKAHAVLSSVLQAEVKRGRLPRNPCWPVEPVRVPLAEHKALTRAQARRVVEAIEARRNSARWKVGLACGLRQGEALGLRWPYVGEHELRVWWQLQRLTWRHGCDEDDPAPRAPRDRGTAIGRRGDSAPVKSAPAAGRDSKAHTRHPALSVPPNGSPGSPYPCGRKRGADCPERHSGGLVMREIKEHRRKAVAFGPLLGESIGAQRLAQDAERQAAGSAWQDLGFCFTQPNGRPVDPRADWQEWSGILADAGIPHVGVHGGRHTTATVAIGEGITLPVVQEMLGHGSIGPTRGYVTVTSAAAAAAAERMDRALFGLEDGGEDLVERFVAFLGEVSPDDFAG